MNHAEDRFLFTDPMFLPLLEQLAPQLTTLEGIVVLSDAGHMPTSGLAGLVDYESLIADLPAEFPGRSSTRPRRAALLHVRHHRPSQGRALSPPRCCTR